MAGDLLVALTPETDQPLEEILTAIPSTWNLSVEQLPFYLRDVYGRDEVVAAFQRLVGRFPPDSSEARAVLTISWWLSGKGVQRTAELGAEADPCPPLVD